MAIDGDWDITAQTPMGPQTSKLTIKTDGDTFTGTNVGPMGSADLEDGKIDGNTLTWSMKMMGMDIKGTATIDGDTIKGSLNSPMGDATMEGTRT